jgi:KDO2-lipid IV(A) lauroyltransferase
MAKPRIALIDWTQYVGLRLVSMMLQCFPVDDNLRTARLLGDLMYRFDRKHRDRALGNLRKSFPEMPEAQRCRVARRSMQQLFMLFVEVLFTTRLVTLENWADFCELENFGPVLRLLLQRDLDHDGGGPGTRTGRRGLLLLTGHYGNWEILGYVLAVLGFSTTSIARPLDNPQVNAWLLGVREKRGQRIIAKTGATEEVVAALDQAGTIGFIADQNAGRKGIFVDFFGRKASTYKSIALLAMTYDVPIVIGYARRVGNRFHFRVGVQDIIYPADWEGKEDPIRYVTQRYTKGIEDFIRTDPGQYLWIHRRWKTRPKGETAERFD